MTGRAERLDQGACVDLPIEVVDKYFLANGNTEPFQQAVAKAICGRCPVEASCLEAAIATPTQGGVRGGESASAIIELAERHRKTGTPIEDLAAGALDRRLPLGGLQSIVRLRNGSFRDVPLLRPRRRQSRAS